LIRFWRGEERLWKAFWFIGILGGWLFTTLVKNLVVQGWLGILPQILLLVSYSIYSGVAIWRSAFNTAWVGWGYAARGVIVLSLVIMGAGIAGVI